MKVNKKTIINIVIMLLAYALVFVLINSGVLSRQYKSLIVPICVNIMLAVSLNLVTGFLGELSLGHAGFMSIGAYSSALLSIALSNTFPPVLAFFTALICGGISAAFFGFLIGVPVLRLRGDYLAIVTLAFGEIIKSIINYLKITGGSKGLSKIPLYSDYKNFTVVFVIMVITIVLISNLIDSRDGRAIKSIRDNDIAAESIGINISRYKVMAFVIAAGFAGIAGALYAHNVGIIKPGIFDYNKSIEILVFVVLGGMGNIPGSIISAIILTLLPEFLRGADNLRMLLYAIVLIVMMIFNNSKFKSGLSLNRTFRKLGREE
ncbi:branched-chain amino acid ABC transporter permease [Lachnoanaerobaculum saburreum]|jgi:inner-membrane translocator|uniref:Branched-chain amino acid ABC transporter, permease protein n=1 Tax=Lachnoanaerobaculum saburreum DSM 3986 TaxID=887325 RepID=E6LPT0_9FIRM|nr:branched-chain amino acid ABC transporter permease [Lachnoanaerobaculum saburreum]EFU76178.1 branched-chain amino acid ABC transporter, permease protein [Lachnoanaerobaculum saburreum DSM 3986]RKW47012.1 MAG: branched-chain amino acid ABC transporter permease [Lachnospiraceae bacterium]